MTTKLRRSLGWVSISCVALAAGCSSGSDQSSASEFVTAYANAWCPKLTPCCTAHSETNDVSACKTFLSLAAANPKGKLDQAKADQCLSELQTWTCDQAQPEACDEVFVGSTPPGGTCTSSSDCAPPADGKARCHYSTTSSKGTCKVTPTPAAGQPCGQNAETATEYYQCDTDPGFYCDSTSSTCKARVAIGQACTGLDCVKDASCDYSTKTCVALTAVGGDCTSSQCVSTAYCDQTSHTCSAKKPDGSPCTVYDECTGYCDSATQKCVPEGSGSYSCFTTK